jgi:imidazole glycerol-phosphate synthase subunit HisH
LIYIIDYGIGNLASIQNMFKKADVSDTVISNDVKMLQETDKIVLPGVGHFDNGMQKLKASGLYDILNQKVIEEKTPVLGICLGAEMLLAGSEEGDESGLGWIDGYCHRFDVSKMSEPLPVPNMGWAEVEVRKGSKLVEGLPPEPRFYFTHSYHIVCKNPSDELLSTNYGFEYTAAVEKENIFGTQFHPEKSHKFGMKLLSNFANI